MTCLSHDIIRFLDADVHVADHPKAISVRAYLDKLAAACWTCFGDAKYGWTGNTDWRTDLYTALYSVGLMTRTGENGEPTDEEEDAADTFIERAISCRHVLEEL
jgi:hypothetical protein